MDLIICLLGALAFLVLGFVAGLEASDLIGDDDV